MQARGLLLTQLACACLLACALASPVRIALYCGGGASECAATAKHCCEPQADYLATLTNAARMAFGSEASGGRGFSVANLTAAAVPRLIPSQYDVVVFPGGSGNGQAAAVGPTGLAALRDFVAAGKGYIGTCGGSFLGLQHAGFYMPAKHAPCGDVSAAGKLLQPHCTPVTQEPWDRGDGDVLVEFTQGGLAQLNLSTPAFAGNVTIFYAQGPIIKGDALPPAVSQLAFYRSEIHSKNTNATTGEMVNTPAITSLDGYGGARGGRVVLNSPHPELTAPPIPAIYAGELEWIMRKQ